MGMIEFLWNLTGMVTLLLIVGTICYTFVKAFKGI